MNLAIQTPPLSTRRLTSFTTSSVLRTRIVLKRKHPFTELIPTPPSRGDYTSISPQERAIIIRSIRTYAAIVDSKYNRSRIVWQTVEKYWQHVWSWIDFLHRRPNPDSIRVVIAIFDGLTQNTEHPPVRGLLLSQPNAIAILVDCWFRLPRQADILNIKPWMALIPLTQAISAIYCDLDDEAMDFIIERELYRGARGSGRRLFRHIATIIRTLIDLPLEQEHGALVTVVELASALFAEGNNPYLQPQPMPRSMVRAAVQLVRKDAGSKFEILAQAACFFLHMTWEEMDLRPMLWSLKEGLLPHILRMKDPELRKDQPAELLKLIHIGLAHRRVLRMFWKVYERDRKEIENAPWKPKQFTEMLKRAERNRETYEELLPTWRGTEGYCHNPETLYQCPCKTSYYCSIECQRADWDIHKDDCHMWQWYKFEETEHPRPSPMFNQRDMEYIQAISREYIDALDDVTEKAEEVEPGLDRTVRLAVSWCHGEPSHHVLKTTIPKRKTVILTAAVMMGQELVLVTLPTLTIRLRDEGDPSDSEAWSDAMWYEDDGEDDDEGMSGEDG
uniref:MYND-type domain-containing protein n=1 Tax=Schizophyllum commune (strain H4-8 / FGSC 9210) TaxID=578458 RepID=D8PQT5_SCHCM